MCEDLPVRPLVALLLSSAGCSSVLGLAAPALEQDAAAGDAPADARADALGDAPACPATRTFMIVPKVSGHSTWDLDPAIHSATARPEVLASAAAVRTRVARAPAVVEVAATSAVAAEDRDQASATSAVAAVVAARSSRPP
jgi:hypothetical protein